MKMFQKIYIEKVLSKFNHTDCFSVAISADPNKSSSLRLGYKRKER